MSYNIINYDSSNLEILYDIHTSNGVFRANGRDIVSDTSNYTLNTSNNISDRLNNSVFSQWTTNGTDINYIVGKVGIGTTNPIAGELHISETTGTTHGFNSGTIILDHENNGGASSIVFRSKFNRGSDYGYIQYQDTSAVGGSGESARLFIGTNNETDDHICLMPSGSVGIGTATPLRKLHIQGDINYTGGLYLNNVLQSFASDTYAVTTSNVISTRITNLPQPNLAPYRLITDSYTKTEDNTFNTNNSNYTLNSSNNISLRLSTLNANSISNGSTNKFIVNGIYTGNVNIDGTLTASNLIIPGTITTLNTDIYATEQLQILNSSTGTALNIKQNNSLGDVINASNLTTEVFTIINNGDIGIGTTNPDGKLHIVGTRLRLEGVFNHCYIEFFPTGPTLRKGYFGYADANTNNITLDNSVGNILLLSNNVGIGTNTPAKKLHVAGDIAATGRISSFYSDERLKEDIKKIESPLNIIENLKGFYYKPNELAKSFGIKNDKREIGLSAQDVKRVLPEIVSLAPFDISRDSSNNIVSKSGEDYLTICYERMIPVIVEAIKELNNEIKELKRVNKELMENK
jgi:hypothetical protein